MGHSFDLLIIKPLYLKESIFTSIKGILIARNFKNSFDSSKTGFGLGPRESLKLSIFIFDQCITILFG